MVKKSRKHLSIQLFFMSSSEIWCSEWRLGSDDRSLIASLKGNMVITAQTGVSLQKSDLDFDFRLGQ